MKHVAVLGAGKIGEALLSGLLDAGRSPEQLMFHERHADRAAALTERYGVRHVDVATAGAEADILVVAVKPQDIEPLLVELVCRYPGRNRATGGVDRTGRIFPIIKIISRDGIKTLPDKQIAARFKATVA